MIVTGKDGKDYPKPDPAMLELLNIITSMRNEKQIILQYETKKQLNKGEAK